MYKKLNIFPHHCQEFVSPAAITIISTIHIQIKFKKIASLGDVP
jgi:hypothetical protein